MSGPRVLIAGIGNIFMGDDGFGVAVAQCLLERGTLKQFCVRDFGIRGFDLACALMDGCDVLIMVDAVQRSLAPGTIVVIEPELTDASGFNSEAGPELHAMTPANVFRLLKSLGGELPKQTRIVGCEPESFGLEDAGDPGLSPVVVAAVDAAVPLIERLVEEMLADFAAHA